MVMIQSQQKKMLKNKFKNQKPKTFKKVNFISSLKLKEEIGNKNFKIVGKNNTKAALLIKNNLKKLVSNKIDTYY